MQEPSEQVVDVVIIGAGAAGLMAAIFAGRTNPARHIVLLDGAKSLGAKILVAGGGRCNVTHYQVDEDQYAGSSRKAIRKVLKRFDVPETIHFFRELGVELKREETGKLFPTTDRARTVLDALLDEVRRVGVDLRFPRRVESIERRMDGSFIVRGDWGAITCRAVVLATGGKSLPKSGSDGHGHALATSLGHTITPRVFPSLVPLIVRDECFVRALSGIAVPATLEVRSGSGKRLASFTNSTLCTHFGLSGPGPLDISRYLTDARLDDPGATLVVNWLPGESFASIDAWLLDLGKRRVGRALAERLPERFAFALCAEAGVDTQTTGHALTRDHRRALAHAICEMTIPVVGDRGYTYAEVTAGGVPLREVKLETMASRHCPGLYLCGEICDVDGRIGGFNFQWAWASGFVAGSAVAEYDAVPADAPG